MLLLMCAEGTLLCWHPTGRRGAMSTRPADSRRSSSAAPPCLLAPGMAGLPMLLLLAVQGAASAAAQHVFLGCVRTQITVGTDNGEGQHRWIAALCMCEKRLIRSMQRQGP
jgi:hypothetical protein